MGGFQVCPIGHTLLYSYIILYETEKNVIREGKVQTVGWVGRSFRILLNAVLAMWTVRCRFQGILFVPRRLSRRAQ